MINVHGRRGFARGRQLALELEWLEPRRVLSAAALCSHDGAAQSAGESNNQYATISELINSARTELYERDLTAGWAEGDWNGTERFDSTDIVFAMQNESVSVPQLHRGKFDLVDTADSLEPSCTSWKSAFEVNESTPDGAPETRASRELARGETYSVIELSFDGPHQTAKDTPARDIDFSVTFRHENGLDEYTVLGYWDGDGHGGINGNQFKVRFTPTRAGRWGLVSVQSNTPLLRGQHLGDYVVAVASANKGFWIPDINSQQHSWYQRSDGSHQYIVGNTHYTLLTETEPSGRETDSSIATDIVKNAQYFNKLRFSILSDISPHPTAKPFLDDDGEPTDSGVYAHRPNPAWFHNRADVAVTTASHFDLAVDLIVSGVASYDSRRVLSDCKEKNLDRCQRPYGNLSGRASCH